ncbi:hypothetical protein [Massilia sp. Leaf139]|uniref:hypothetical protein n=1 Tax=Massilia sp. Leaf139 TaxID=1736272 RepID=UPI0006F4EE75|nr:hypothetical protein [Massilia sp. Leaf139]KQQ92439.1 hypothetical protein ASF77_22820 [Massilia sp. Leaf139]
MKTARAEFRKRIDWLHETGWLTMFAYAHIVFFCGRLLHYALPDAIAPHLDRPLLILPLLLLVAKDLAGAPDFARRMRHVARPGTAWTTRLGALLPPEFLAMLKLDRAMWRAFFRWLRRDAPPARPAGANLTYTRQGAYGTVLGIVVCAVLIELPIDATIAHFLLDNPTARTVLHVISAVSAVYTLAWVTADRWSIKGAQGHILSATTLDLSVGIRAFGTIPLAAIEACERVDAPLDQWCKRHGIARRDTVLVTPFDAPNCVLRLDRTQPVTITHYQREKVAPRYVFLYLDRPDQLITALAPAGAR